MVHLTYDAHVAKLVERLLDSESGISEEVFDLIHKMSIEMPDCLSKKYIRKMLHDADAMDGYFYLKDDYNFLFKEQQEKKS